MELRHLRYFAAIAEELNFTRAAQKVGVTQSTLSHQIKQLEDELGVTLFERTLKKVALTYAGEQLMRSVGQAMKELDRGIRALKHTDVPAGGTLRIGATNATIIIEHLALFLERYPSTKVTVEQLPADRLEKGVLSERFDLAIGQCPSKSRELRSEQLFSEPLVVIVSTRHPLANRKRIRVVELHEKPLALLSRKFAARISAERCFKAAEATPNVLVEFNNVRLISGLIRLRPIATVLPELTIPPSPDLQKIPLVDPSSSRTIGLLWKKDKQYPASALAFASLVKSSSRKRLFELS